MFLMLLIGVIIVGIAVRFVRRRADARSIEAFMHTRSTIAHLSDGRSTSRAPAEGPALYVRVLDNPSSGRREVPLVERQPLRLPRPVHEIVLR
jgi:hypothetical protein